MKKPPTSQLLVLIVLLCSFTGGDNDEESSKYVWRSDITLLLKEDLEANVDINLPEGHFYTSETIIAENDSGTVSGAGKGQTIIEAAQGFKALPDPYFGQAGTELTAMFKLYWCTGDIIFKDITFLVTGEAPSISHNNPFAGITTTIDNIVVVGECLYGPITITYKNLQIKGESSNDTGSRNGQNLLWPLIALWMNSEYPINLIMEICEIENCGRVALEFWHAHGGTGEINNNVFSNSHGGVWLGPGMTESEVNVKNNAFSNISTDAISNNLGCSGCFMNNTLDGEPMADDYPKSLIARNIVF